MIIPNIIGPACYVFLLLWYPAGCQNAHAFDHMSSLVGIWQLW